MIRRALYQQTQANWKGTDLLNASTNSYPIKRRFTGVYWMASRPHLPFEEPNGKIIEISYEHFRINGQLPHRHFFLGREKFKLEQRPINAWKKSAMEQKFVGKERVTNPKTVCVESYIQNPSPQPEAGWLLSGHITDQTSSAQSPFSRQDRVCVRVCCSI